MSDPAVVETKKQNIMNSQTVWPGAFGAFKYSKSAVMLALKPLLILLLSSTALTSILYYPVISNSSKIGTANQVTLPLGSVIILNITSILVAIIIVVLLLNATQGKKIKLTDAVKSTLSPKLLINYTFCNIIVGAFLIASAFLLFIPVLFWGPRLALTLYYLIDQKMNCLDAISASWKATKGNVGKVWGIIGVYIVISLPVITIIGIPFAIYLLFMYQAALIVLYQNIKTSSPPAVEPVAVV